MDNLNEFLNAKDCLNTQKDSTNSFQFDVNTERSTIGNVQLRNASISNAKLGTAVIGTAQVGTMSFNEIHGGTGTFGGTSSGSGVVSVLNQSGTEIVRLDSSGVTVSNGSITIKNTSGSNIIDSNGLVSTNVFTGSQIIKSSNQTTTNTSFEAVSSFSISTLNFPRSTNIFITSTLTGYHNDADGLLIGGLMFNGTQIGPEFIIGRGMAPATQYVLPSSVGVSYLYLAPTGVGTIGVGIRQNNSPGIGLLNGAYLACILNYISLGQ